jgi:hypothetical protein
LRFNVSKRVVAHGNAVPLRVAKIQRKFGAAFDRPAGGREATLKIRPFGQWDAKRQEEWSRADADDVSRRGIGSFNHEGRSGAEREPNRAQVSGGVRVPRGFGKPECVAVKRRNAQDVVGSEGDMVECGKMFHQPSIAMPRRRRSEKYSSDAR